MNWLRFARLDVVPKPSRALQRDDLGRYPAWPETVYGDPQKYVLDWLRTGERHG